MNWYHLLNLHWIDHIFSEKRDIFLIIFQSKHPKSASKLKIYSFQTLCNPDIAQFLSWNQQYLMPDPLSFTLPFGRQTLTSHNFFVPVILTKLFFTKLYEGLNVTKHASEVASKDPLVGPKYPMWVVGRSRSTKSDEPRNYWIFHAFQRLFLSSDTIIIAGGDNDAIQCSFIF